MGIIVPDHLPLSSLANEDERAVVEALRDHLSDDWLVFPDVGIAAARDHQMDIVIAHPRDGIAVVEVKGHRVELRDGAFFSHGVRVSPQPDEQARANAYELRKLLRAHRGPLANVDVEYAIAFPNTAAVRGALPPDLLPAQVLTGPSLDDPAAAVDRLMTARWRHGLIGPDGLRAITEVLRPDADFEWDDEARARRARRRMDELCAQRVHALELLDGNRRVIVTGGAGSGKSRLAVAWARRAVGRGERALLTCFNDPLAEDLRERLAVDDRLTVGSFFEAAFAFDGMPPIERPADADTEWWETTAVGHLHSHWPKITERFDVVIVDEAQDFSPAWLAQLAALLDVNGPCRLMLLCDEAQGVFARGFVAPPAGEGWTSCRLEANCRNTFGIASILHRHLGGGQPIAGPESLDARWCEANDLAEAMRRVGEEVDRIEGEGYATSRILVATTHRATRDQLRETMGFGAWEQRGEHTIVCENVQRMKGLEFDFVLLVADWDVTDLLLYVGLSRAVVGFALVGPRDVAARLGLATGADDSSA